ncbi:PHB depolymerase family esterase [Streptomyces sp. VNUA24]|uniref:extracellular catalytic domain type 1 short-chain-length polyhydroxyalkanoate depolymerase n=1 Tax=Streptomyces sp. VNUA24 TaxID=3031131 RepID=UPI0023B7EDCA|nr:PHB depolymerase family esterase [Streptomyces sp. VNUA24]WEH12979.1 PHB depolymerase family esterase [Streptomyces sp. VNUA24]
MYRHRPLFRTLFACATAALVTAAALVPSATAAGDGATAYRGCSLQPGRTTLTVRSGGLDRVVVVYAPQRTTPRGRLPLVLNLHGSQGTATNQLDGSQLEETAENEGFLVAAPQGAMVLGAGYQWNVPHVTEGDGPDDEQFLTDTITRLVRSGCADDDRVYATGYSGGARMVSQYACDHPGRLAAIAPVAGLRAGAPMTGADGGLVPDPGTCTPERPVPVVAFAGTADWINPFPGGGAAYWGYGVVAAQSRWAALDGCRRGPRDTRISEHVTRTAYTRCRGGSEVTLYAIEGGGHTWPGATVPWPPVLGTVTQEISANQIMWRFFRDH